MATARAFQQVEDEFRRAFRVASRFEVKGTRMRSYVIRGREAQVLFEQGGPGAIVERFVAALPKNVVLTDDRDLSRSCLLYANQMRNEFFVIAYCEEWEDVGDADFSPHFV